VKNLHLVLCGPEELQQLELAPLDYLLEQLPVVLALLHRHRLADQARHHRKLGQYRPVQEHAVLALLHRHRLVDQARRRRKLQEGRLVLMRHPLHRQ
jgi:hypothetical protein